MIGQKIGAYRLKRELGEGAFGVVYEADEEFDGRGFAQVALKIIRPRDRAHRASLIGELATLANFRHPNIVGYRAFGELPPDGDAALAPIYIALELANGTLADRIGKHPFSPRRLLELARDVAEGLAFIARQGWTHRDIKPDNLLCFISEAETTWKIADLGLARPTTTQNAPTDTPANAAGTRHYMAPEVWRGMVAPCNDVWALGLCLREAATGQRLWDDVAPAALPVVVSDDSTPLDVEMLPQCVRDLARGCLQRDPVKRWSAAQVAARARQELAQLPEETPNSLVVSLQGEGTHSSIREALSAASPGARITVMPGHYLENLVIERDVHLVGFVPPGGAAGAVAIESGAAIVVKVGGGNVSLENLTVRGSARQSGKKFHAVSLVGAQVHFKNCRISSDSLAGLVVGQGAQATLESCHVEAAAQGILGQDGGHIKIEGGKIANCGRNGIEIQSRARLEARRVVVSGCRENGVWLGDATVAFLLNCKFTGNARQGVRAHNTALARIEHCEAQGNGFGAWEIPLGAEVTRIRTRPA